MKLMNISYSKFAKILQIEQWPYWDKDDKDGQIQKVSENNKVILQYIKLVLDNNNIMEVQNYLNNTCFLNARGIIN